jgi:glycosyltransferase involved in cell wall biosynthesis
MKVLQLCSKVPYPAKDGGCLAMLNLAEMLNENQFEVKILAIETYKHPAPKSGYPQSFAQNFKPESIFINTRTSIFKALYNLVFSQNSYHLIRFKSKEFSTKLISILNSYNPDLVVLDSLFTCGYIDEIKMHSNAKIIYRAHNVEHIIWQEISLKTKSYFKRKYLALQSLRLKKEELEIISKCDGILAITDKDMVFFNKNYDTEKLMNLPFTVDTSLYNYKNQYNQKSIFFIGAMDWYPNFEGVKWFIDKVWPMVVKEHPTANFYIAGKAMPDELKTLESRNIFNMGEVADAKKFMDMYPIMVAPIFSGGGLKIKIVEAMAMGKVVICNRNAVTGIPFTDKKNILIADDVEAFAKTIISCFENIINQEHIGKSARLLIEEHFSSFSKGKTLNLFLKSILETKK